MKDSYCGRSDERIHIGKSSGGWCFSLHVVPEEGINDLEDWEKVWNLPESVILDEYDECIPPSEMKEIITERSWEKVNLTGNPYYESEAQFLRENYAVRGPKGLLRHQIDDRHCIKHGKGTWDCILGEFS
ncbi:MAG: hypothetical protein ABIC57_00585 [bacterium]